MATNKTRTLAVNLPRGEAGQRIEAALNIIMEEEDRSMSKTILRILIKNISQRDPAFHERVIEEANAINEERGNGGEV